MKTQENIKALRITFTSAHHPTFCLTGLQFADLAYLTKEVCACMCARVWVCVLVAVCFASGISIIVCSAAATVTK